MFIFMLRCKLLIDINVVDVSVVLVDLTKLCSLCRVKRLHTVLLLCYKSATSEMFIYVLFKT